MFLTLSLWVVIAVFGIQVTKTWPPKTWNPSRYDWNLLQNHTNYNLLHWGDNCGLQAATTNTTDEPTNYIYWGHRIKAGEYPWVVLLKPVRCSGSILNKWWILTAARCYKVTEIYFGYMSAEGDKYPIPGPWAQTRGVWGEIRHEDYHEASYPNMEKLPVHDIMLLKLHEPLEFTEYIQPICMTPPEYSHCLDESSGVRAVGWGQPALEEQNDARSVDVHLLPYASCKSALAIENKTYYPQYQLCALNSEIFGLGGALCKGDRGAPLFKTIAIGTNSERAYQVGVFSYAPYCNFTDTTAYWGKVSIYSKLSYYALWILDNIQDIDKIRPPHKNVDN